MLHKKGALVSLDLDMEEEMLLALGLVVHMVVKVDMDQQAYPQLIV